MEVWLVTDERDFSFLQSGRAGPLQQRGLGFAVFCGKLGGPAQLLVVEVTSSVLDAQERGTHTPELGWDQNNWFQS